MDMRVKDQGLAPGVEHSERADKSAELGRRYVQQGLAGGAQQDCVEDLWRVQSQGVQRLGNGEDDVEVRNVENFLASLLEPALTRLGAAPGTVPVATGVPEDVLVVAAITPVAVAAQGIGAAVGDRAQHFALGWRGGAAGQKIPALRARDRAE